MKKHLICILAIGVAIAASSFTYEAKSSAKQSMAGHKWWDFNGGLLDQCDPAAFSLDPNNFPDCPPALGLIFCEIYAMPSAWDPSQPDLGSIISTRYRPLL